MKLADFVAEYGDPKTMDPPLPVEFQTVDCVLEEGVFMDVDKKGHYQVEDYHDKSTERNQLTDDGKDLVEKNQIEKKMRIFAEEIKGKSVHKGFDLVMAMAKKLKDHRVGLATTVKFVMFFIYGFMQLGPV